MSLVVPVDMLIPNPPKTSTYTDSEPETPARLWDDEANKRILDELFTHVSSYRTTAAYRQLLDFVSQFPFYAPFNAMLVHVQKPGARYVRPAHRWWQDYGRRIRPGAQPLVILQPMGPVMFVFDVSETEGDAIPPEIENPFAVRGGRVEKQLERTVDNAGRDGIRITETRLGSQQAGSIRITASPRLTIRFSESNEVPLRYELLLNLNHEATARYATLVHELAHLYCGHLGTPDVRWWPDRRGLSHDVREFEAESVAYLVCRRTGIEPKSDEYLAGYLKSNDEIPSISLDCVLKVAGLAPREQAATESDLLAYCRERLSDYKRPKQIHITDAIPRTATGKIQRRVVAEAYSKKAS
jgi:hypothetical protein